MSTFNVAILAVVSRLVAAIFSDISVRSSFRLVSMSSFVAVRSNFSSIDVSLPCNTAFSSRIINFISVKMFCISDGATVEVVLLMGVIAPPEITLLP